MNDSNYQNDTRKNTIAVSVIIPVYNAEKYLRETIDSLLNQTLYNIEIICVDDGSTDSSLEILLEYKNVDNRIKIISQENSYAGVARNNGLDIAVGDYISFLDADDIFEAEMLEHAYNMALEHNSDIVIFGGKTFEVDIKHAINRPDFARFDLIKEINEVNIFSCSEFIFNITNPAPWNKLYSSEFIKKNGLRFQACKRGNDVYFTEMALVLAERINILNETLIYYRKSSYLGLQSGKDKEPTYFIKPFSDIYNELKKRKLYQKVCISFSNLFVSSCLYNLESLNDTKAFENLYNTLKNDVFKELGIEAPNILLRINASYRKKVEYILSNEASSYGLHGEGIKKEDREGVIFPYDLVKKDETLILYGAGKVGQSYYKQIENNKYCKIKNWVDLTVTMVNNIRIQKPDMVSYSDIDHVVIAVLNYKVASEIKTYLISLGVDENKIIWKGDI